MLGTPLDGTGRIVAHEYIGSQVLQMLLAHHNLVLTRGGDDELSIAPSNIAMASASSSNFLVPTMAANNLLLAMGLFLSQLPDGSFEVRPMSIFPQGSSFNALRLPGDECTTRAMRTSPL